MLSDAYRRFACGASKEFVVHLYINIFLNMVSYIIK